MAIEKNGDSQSFNYTGNIQTFTVPYTGLYELKLNGASGGKIVSTRGEGHENHKVGLGGTTTQYVPLKKDDILYIVVGGAGGYSEGDCTYGRISVTGGYNGGGDNAYGGDTRPSQCAIAGGGGATHIAKKTGLLKDLENDKDSILAVAGGGGGYDYFRMYWDDEWVYDMIDGAGGGGLVSEGSYPASQTTAGGRAGTGEAEAGPTFGQGYRCGGGGWYGGTSGYTSNHTVSGGSGYLSNNTVYTIDNKTYTSSSISNGSEIGAGGANGSVIITLIKKGNFGINYQKTFYYTGEVEIFEVPFTGVYKLEAYGAQGGTISYYNWDYRICQGGKGGYSCGYKSLTKGTKLYICVGGYPMRNPNDARFTTGGYNGGADGIPNPHVASGEEASGGGGASHIATMTGTLAQIGESNKNKILIVAGGGGGNRVAPYWTSEDTAPAGAAFGGAGGGEKGGDSAAPLAYNNVLIWGYESVIAPGATQTSGYAFGQGGNNGYSGGGGGGLWGGGIYTGGSGAAGAGGSGYVGGVPSIIDNGITYSPVNIAGGSDEPYGLIRISSTNIDPNSRSDRYITYLGDKRCIVKIGSNDIIDLQL